MFTLIDLTRPMTERGLSYPGDRPGIVTARRDPADPSTPIAGLSHLDLHVGTHMDAPLHFIPGAPDIASTPIAVLRAILLRTRERAIPARILPATPIEGCAVLFDTGWSVGPESRAYFENFPHLSPELARALVSRGAALVGIDTPSADAPDAAPDYPAHRILLGAGIPIVEGLSNLGQLPDGPGGFSFAAFPLKIEGADGAPARAVAFLDSD